MTLRRRVARGRKLLQTQARNVLLKKRRSVITFAPCVRLIKRCRRLLIFVFIPRRSRRVVQTIKRVSPTGLFKFTVSLAWFPSFPLITSFPLLGAIVLTVVPLIFLLVTLTVTAFIVFVIMMGCPRVILLLVRCRRRSVMRLSRGRGKLRVPTKPPNRAVFRVLLVLRLLQFCHFRAWRTLFLRRRLEFMLFPLIMVGILILSPPRRRWTVLVTRRLITCSIFNRRLTFGWWWFLMTRRRGQPRGGW